MKITIYTNDTCSQCVTVKRWLDYKKLDYETIDLTNDSKLWEKVGKEAGSFNLPITKINDVYIVGFNVAKFNKAIG